MDVSNDTASGGSIAPRNVDRLIDLFAQTCADLAEAHQDIGILKKKLDEADKKLDDANKTIAEANKKIAELTSGSKDSATTDKVDKPYSVRAEEKRQEKRGKKKRKETKAQRLGRISNEEKIKRADDTEDVYPDGIAKDKCQLSHVRLIWRLIEGRLVLMAYRVYRSPSKRYGMISGALGRSEFGLEIIVELAFLVRKIGLSLDKVCQVVQFLQKLKLKKSQVEALLKQLSRAWEDEFEILCTLLANSLVVHADETSWSVNSVWAFLSEKARLLFFGVHKDGTTLKAILDKDSFGGVLFSDDAAVYANFSTAQKCWAHVLRKAIKLTLQDPENKGYRDFADELLKIYYEANRIRLDKRLGDEGRERKTKELMRRLFSLCRPVCLEHKEATGLDHKIGLLAEELVRLALADELFTFVLIEQTVPHPNGETVPMNGTNNEAEQGVRNTAQARATGRTSKSAAGARRTTILTSVLESLKLYLVEYTLDSVTQEVLRWQKTGCSCFRALLRKLKLEEPSESVLDRLFPSPSG